jgi:hypothetical protein
MNSWIATSDELPHDGDAVLFVVEHRCIVLCGIYADCTFKSRWSRYHPGDISEWRRIDVDAAERSPGEAARIHAESARSRARARAA